MKEVVIFGQTFVQGISVKINSVIDLYHEVDVNENWI
jgi:hypothetical protein